MQYFILFLEGIVTFISPCLLPMLPVYLSFFAGGMQANNKKKVLINSLAFTAGFTVIFLILGAFAGTIGGFLLKHRTALNIVTGAIVIVFGLNYLGIVKISFLNSTKKASSEVKGNSVFSCFLFGIIFSIGWTPCVGAFLGSALLMASRHGSMLQGMLMLFIYSLGLAVPFILSALLLERLKSTFVWIKQHYKIITTISGLFLVLIGISMMFGLMERLLTSLS